MYVCMYVRIQREGREEREGGGGRERDLVFAVLRVSTGGAFEHRSHTVLHLGYQGYHKGYQGYHEYEYYAKQNIYFLTGLIHNTSSSHYLAVNNPLTRTRGLILRLISGVVRGSNAGYLVLPLKKYGQYYFVSEVGFLTHFLNNLLTPIYVFLRFPPP